ncbi:MAG: trypsin-like serine protease [Actinomycetota bacterium]
MSNPQPTFIRVDAKQRFCNPGDSGGPWYSGNQAYGIHSGSGQSGSTYHCFYMAVNYLQSLNLRVMTG